MDIETRKSRLLKRCKYYKGEKECPFEKEMTVWGWECEEFWVRCLLKNDTAPLDSAVAFYRKLVDLSDDGLFRLFDEVDDMHIGIEDLPVVEDAFYWWQGGTDKEIHLVF